MLVEAVEQDMAVDGQLERWLSKQQIIEEMESSEYKSYSAAV